MHKSVSTYSRMLIACAAAPRKPKEIKQKFFARLKRFIKQYRVILSLFAITVGAVSSVIIAMIISIPPRLNAQSIAETVVLPSEKEVDETWVDNSANNLKKALHRINIDQDAAVSGILDNEEKSPYEKYLAINQLAIFNNVRLIDPYVFKQLLPYIHDATWQSLLDNNITGIMLQNTVEMIDEKVILYEAAIGEEILTINDLNAFINNDLEKTMLAYETDGLPVDLAYQKVIQNRFFEFIDNQTVTV
ncbi:MAG: hypothetical protein LBC33_03555, partial [Mycoplasmataceae bacterium]|nr:hypothetical protein [Mycoplasmataceae bacterium]